MQLNGHYLSVEQVPEKIEAWSGIESWPMRLIGCNRLTIKLIKPTGEQAIEASVPNGGNNMNVINWAYMKEQSFFGNVDIDMKVEIILAVK